MTHLQEVAASMAVGTFAALNQDGDGSGYGSALTSSGVGGIYGFASKATHDPVRNRVFHLGAGHNGGQGNPRKFIAYDIESNIWHNLPLPSWVPTGTGNNHAYQLEGIIQNKFVKCLTNSVYTYAADIDRDDILQIAASNPPIPDRLVPNPPPSSLNRGCLDGFPERNSALCFDSGGTGKVYEWAYGFPSWVHFKTLNYINASGITVAHAGDGTAAAYNPIHAVWVIGGGQAGAGYSRRWWCLSSAGILLRIDDCPVDTYAHGKTLFACDPVSGKFILIRPQVFSGSQPGPCWFYELDLTRSTGEQWIRRPELEAGIPTFDAMNPNTVVYTVCVPIPVSQGGVVLFMANAKTWILKYAESVLPPLPAIPTNLGVIP